MTEDFDAEAARRIGTTVGTWRIEQILGAGGMATVYLGRRDDGLVGAIKILHLHLSGISELRKRFLREGPIGSALATLGPLCEGIVQVYETGVTDDGAAFMVMEMLDGETALDRVMRKGPLPVEEVLRIAHKVLDVLVVAHAYGVVHRDLKPDNIHCGRDGRVKVLDFGIARVVEPLPPGTAELIEKTATRMGVALGSGEYMAPEQAAGRNDEIDGRTDIFNLGATMYTLLAGQYIHGDVGDAMRLVAAASQRVPALASVAPTIPPVVCAVVDRALAFHQNERYPDAATARFDVYALRSGKQPPYVLGIAEGRIRPGDKLPRHQ